MCTFAFESFENVYAGALQVCELGSNLINLFIFEAGVDFLSLIPCFAVTRFLSWVIAYVVDCNHRSSAFCTTFIACTRLLGCPHVKTANLQIAAKNLLELLLMHKRLPLELLPLFDSSSFWPATEFFSLFLVLYCSLRLDLVSFGLLSVHSSPIRHNKMLKSIIWQLFCVCVYPVPLSSDTTFVLSPILKCLTMSCAENLHLRAHHFSPFQFHSCGFGKWHIIIIIGSANTSGVPEGCHRSGRW